VEFESFLLKKKSGWLTMRLAAFTQPMALISLTALSVVVFGGSSV
jgi:hypothetical protein